MQFQSSEDEYGTSGVRAHLLEPTTTLLNKTEMQKRLNRIDPASGKELRIMKLTFSNLTGRLTLLSTTVSIVQKSEAFHRICLSLLKGFNKSINQLSGQLTRPSPLRQCACQVREYPFAAQSHPAARQALPEQAVPGQTQREHSRDAIEDNL